VILAQSNLGNGLWHRPAKVEKELNANLGSARVERSRKIPNPLFFESLDQVKHMGDDPFISISNPVSV
jgi:hypothetical protein